MDQLESFNKYYYLLIEGNNKFNLTAITEIKDVAIKHFIDSLTCLTVIDIANNSTIMDIGTGAGFPGIPLKIMRPDLKITLLDSLGKRVNFLNETADILGLDNIKAIHGRAEDLVGIQI
ncbi:hypothetical protein N752_08475 [Desulforamulus aquiferis]|nr:hypothetical protein N752_08475 [Desulforamulus aquiferis]